VTIAPTTVKLLAATPVKVQPAFAVSTIWAVYASLSPNGLFVGDQLIVPVYCAVFIAVVTRGKPSTGITIPGIASKVIVLSDAGVPAPEL